MNGVFDTVKDVSNTMKGAFITVMYGDIQLD
jgi:hypothetical protein